MLVSHVNKHLLEYRDKAMIQLGGSLIYPVI